MIRIIIEWLISQTVDSGKAPGPILSRWLAVDPASRRFYDDLRELDDRLRADAIPFLESKEPALEPLRGVGRTVLRFPSGKGRRRLPQTVALALFFFFGAGLFFSQRFFPESRVVAGPKSEQTFSVADRALNDPLVQNELTRLCRRNPDLWEQP